MTATSFPAAAKMPRLRVTPVRAVTAVAFLLCFGIQIADLVRAWLSVSDAAHGLLIAPVAIWLAWRIGVVSNDRPAILSGLFVLFVAVVFYVLGRTAGVETIPRVALWVALVGLTAWGAGWRQVLAWWLPFVLLALTIPLPESLIVSTTLPLQGLAAKMGAALLEWRHIPVFLSGNVIKLPGHTLFVSEACSGLRSLTALVSMAILIGALFLAHPISRIVMLVLAMVIAVLINGVRVFLTGFLVYFVDPALGDGFMHLTEGYLLFLISLALMAGLAWLCMRVERSWWPDRPSLLTKMGL